MVSATVVAGLFLNPVLAYLLPPNPMDVWPRSKAFVNLAMQVVPAIERIAAGSTTPQVTEFFMALQWMIWAPLCAVLFFVLLRPTEETVLHAMRVGGRCRFFLYHLVPVATAVLLFSCVFLPGVNASDTPHNEWIVLPSRSRLWLGFWGYALTTVSGFAVAAFLRSFSVMRLAYAVRKQSPFHKEDPK